MKSFIAFTAFAFFIASTTAGASTGQKNDPIKLRGSTTETATTTTNQQVSLASSLALKAGINNNGGGGDGGGDNEQDRRSRLLLTDDQSETLYNLVSSFGGAIPVAGPFITFIAAEYWPATGDSIWDSIEDSVQDYVDAAILTYQSNQINNDLGSLEENMDYYNAVTSPSSKANYLDLIVSDCTDLRFDLQMDRDWVHGSANSDQKFNNMLLMEYAVVFAPIHLAVLRERYLYGKFIYDDWDNDEEMEADLDLWYEELNDQAEAYETYFTYMNTQFESWRDSVIDISVECEGYAVWLGVMGWTTYYKGRYVIDDEVGERSESNWPNNCEDHWTCAAAKNCARTRAQNRVSDFISDATADFADLVDPVLTIYSDVMDKMPTNYDEFCPLDEGYAWDPTAQEMACLAVPACLENDVDNDCAIDEMCFKNSDCASGWCGNIKNVCKE